MGKIGPAWKAMAGKTRFFTKRLNIAKISKPKKVQGRAWKRKQFNKRNVQIQLQKVLSGKVVHLRGILLHRKGPNWHKGNKQLLEKEKIELIYLKRELKRNKFNK